MEKENAAGPTYSYQGKRNYHVTLVRPPAVFSAASMTVSSLTPPLALAYLSGALRKAEISVTNIDSIGEGLDNIYPLERNPNMEAQGLTPTEIISRIPKDTHLIGVSCMFSLEWPNTRDLITEIRSAFPETLIVGGGEHLTALPEFSLEECPALDAIIMGEGDLVLLDAAETLIRGGDLSEVNALVRRSEGQIVRQIQPPDKKVKKNARGLNVFDGVSEQRMRDIDHLAWPAWDLTPIENYLERRLTFGRHTGITMPIMGSRGCPFECTFCSNPLMWGRRYVTREAKDVVKEILYYKEKYQIEAVEFYDLTPIVKKDWIIEFCEELMRTEANITWQISGGTRCEAIDEEVIVKAKASGCQYLGFAPESGSKEVLKRIKKRVNLERMLDLIRISAKHELDTRCNIVIGFPEDTRWQIYVSLLFNFRLAFMGVVDSPIFEFTPYPGSELFEKLQEQGVITELDDDYFENLGLNLQIKGRRQYCKRVPPWEIYIYRTIGMSVFYGIYYLLRPMKLISFIKNLFNYKVSNSVFEQRIIQNFQRKYQKQKAS